MFSLCAARDPEWRAYASRWAFAVSNKSEAIGMADVIFLAVGAGAFAVFALLATALKRV